MCQRNTSRCIPRIGRLGLDAPTTGHVAFKAQGQGPSLAVVSVGLRTGGAVTPACEGQALRRGPGVTAGSYPIRNARRGRTLSCVWVRPFARSRREQDP